jgi:hypothetical protein
MRRATRAAAILAAIAAGIHLGHAAGTAVRAYVARWDQIGCVDEEM